jgi:hypothetical protein
MNGNHGVGGKKIPVRWNIGKIIPGGGGRLAVG